MKKLSLILLGIVLGFAGSVLANKDPLISIPSNFQTNQIVTHDEGRDVPLIQIFCELRSGKGRAYFCNWDYNLQRYTLTCLGLRRLFGNEINYGGMYMQMGCEDWTYKPEEIKD